MSVITDSVVVSKCLRLLSTCKIKGRLWSGWICVGRGDTGRRFRDDFSIEKLAVCKRGRFVRVPLRAPVLTGKRRK